MHMYVNVTARVQARSSVLSPEEVQDGVVRYVDEALASLVEDAGDREFEARNEELMQVTTRPMIFLLITFAKSSWSDRGLCFSWAKASTLY